MNDIVTKAIIPAAGLGTRMFPATISVPKEMLPYGDMPIIEHIVRDAVDSGIRQILIVINEGKNSIIDHFSANEFREKELRKKEKLTELSMVSELQELCQLEFIYQNPLAGLGDAIALGQEFTGSDPFAVLLGDNILSSHTEQTVLSSMIRVFEKYQKSVVAVQEVEPHLVDRYGIMDGDLVEQGVYNVNKWVEKPLVNQAPSHIAVAGQYIFTTQIYEALTKTHKGINGEIQITDAMDRLAIQSEIYAYRINGARKDLGNYKSYIQANIEWGLNSTSYGADMRQWLKEKITEDKPPK